MPRASHVLIGTLVVACAMSSGRAHAEPPQGPREEEAPFIDVLTFGIGDSLFERWGHTALCLRYHDPNLSPVCFNYGVTDFDSVGTLAWNFLRGKQQFWGEPADFRPMVELYQDEDRDIWMQTLPLSAAEARDVEARLWSDLSDERRFYIYEHFTDNCTTGVRDIIDNATHGRLRVDGERRYPLSFRQLVNRGFAEMPPLVAIGEFVLGRNLDDHPTLWQAMFHPHVFQQQLAIRFGATPEVVSSRRGRPFSETGSSGRLVMLLVALAFSLPLALTRWRRRFQRAALVWATLYLTLWGLVVDATVIVSSIGALRWNEAVFVLTPLDVALVFLSPTHRRRYARLRVLGLLLVSLLCALGWLQQPLWIPLLTALMPLALIASE